MVYVCAPKVHTVSLTLPIQVLHRPLSVEVFGRQAGTRGANFPLVFVVPRVWLQSGHWRQGRKILGSIIFPRYNMGKPREQSKNCTSTI